MKTFIAFCAAIAAAGSISQPAYAGKLAPDQENGHYEWKVVPQSGPRTSGPSRVRVWVADEGEHANCDCSMMKVSSAERMKNMPGMMAQKSGTSAG